METVLKPLDLGVKSKLGEERGWHRGSGEALRPLDGALVPRQARRLRVALPRHRPLRGLVAIRRDLT